MSLSNALLVEFLSALSNYEDAAGDGGVAGQLSAMSLDLMTMPSPHELTDEEIDALAKKVGDAYHAQ